MAEGGTEPKFIDGPKGQLEINECLGSWLTYLQVSMSSVILSHEQKRTSRPLVLQTLNGLCTAGTKLAQSLQGLLSAHDTVAQCRLTGQCLAGWEELTRATHVASNTVKNHVITALRDHESRDNDWDKHVSNGLASPTRAFRCFSVIVSALFQDILRENLLTFINLQYQFCVACCECLGKVAVV